MKKYWNGFLSGIMTTVLLFGLVGNAAASVAKQTVEIDYNDIKVTLNEQPIALVDANGDAVEPFTINGTTYLPVRAVANALDLEVGWDGETSTVLLTTPEEARTVYITRTGKKWHYDEHCNGGTYYPVPYLTALQMTEGPCDKCVLKESPIH